ncbi:uncharacterized protein [Channa argus]|uniref:uncharacterized protein n=1 Tax=Channa argus TaxID=215402 RepID=UPI0029455222|nr:hypothetical protein Q8A73_014526 [Channa argus]
MNLWASLTVALFSVLSFHTQAEVVSSFQSCSQYFYKGEEPKGLDPHAKKICQKKNGNHLYATLYSTYHRIPLYSAYKFDYNCSKVEGWRSGNWFIEPQLSKDENGDYTNMNNMKLYTAEESQLIKVKQATNEDYSYTGYDGGHLNPSSFHCSTDGRKATFTLTNSAPMDPCFYRVHWKKREDELIKILEAQDPSGTAYLVTGTVPSNNRIPMRGDLDDDNADDHFNRVTVPTQVWTAVCYIHPQNEKSFSFAFIGENKHYGSIYVRTVEQLTQELSVKYGSNNFKIFSDHCFFSRSEEITENLYSKIDLRLYDKISGPPEIMNAIRIGLSQSGRPKVKLSEAKIDLIYDDMQTWMRDFDKMKEESRFTCPLSTPLSGPVTSISHGKKLRQTSQEVVCSLVPDNLESCSTPCLYNQDTEDYYCSSGSITKPCSPRYSDVTVSGEKCRSDHTCGKHGNDYYSCYTDSSWDYCSPPPPLGVTNSGKRCRGKHNCANYGKSYFWCESEDGNWDYCCRKPNRFSALNGKTCKRESPCDYYGKSYIWCYTTDNEWEYCCTK